MSVLMLERMVRFWYHIVAVIFSKAVYTMLKDKIKAKEKTIGMYVQLADISIARIA